MTRRTLATWAALVMTGTLTACAPLPKGATQADTTRPAHHTDTGFRNLHIDDERKGFGTFLRWQWERRFGPKAVGQDERPVAPTPRITPDLAFIQRNAQAGAAMQPAATWVGHSTVLVQALGHLWHQFGNAVTRHRSRDRQERATGRPARPLWPAGVRGPCTLPTGIARSLGY